MFSAFGAKTLVMKSGCGSFAEELRQGSSILIFVPMYNCAAQIGRVIRQLAATKDLVERLAVLCVDNGSRDGTVEAARNALEQCPIDEVYICSNDENYGLGGSHKVAIGFARTHEFTHIIVLHGDDQGCIDDLLPLVRQGEHLRNDALLGARFQPGARLQNYSLVRTAANHVFNLLFSVAIGRRLHDLGSGLNMFACSIFDDEFHVHFADDLTFNYYLIAGLVHRGHAIRFFPIHWREDDQVSNAKLFSQGLRMLRLLGGLIVDRASILARDNRAVVRDSYPSTILFERRGEILTRERSVA